MGFFCRYLQMQWTVVKVRQSWVLASKFRAPQFRIHNVIESVVSLNNYTEVTNIRLLYFTFFFVWEVAIKTVTMGVFWVLSHPEYFKTVIFKPHRKSRKPICFGVIFVHQKYNYICSNQMRSLNSNHTINAFAAGAQSPDPAICLGFTFVQQQYNNIWSQQTGSLDSHYNEMHLMPALNSRPHCGAYSAGWCRGHVKRFQQLFELSEGNVWLPKLFR